MSDAKWTPGPWMNGRDADGKPLIFASEPSDFHQPEDEALANRRLLDAAPELYEALERIVNAGQFYGSSIELDQYADSNNDGEVLEKIARDALAKARGES